MLITGTLTEAGGDTHSTGLSLIHSSGERIQGVQVCLLGECSKTDSEGQWGMVAPEAFLGGHVEISVSGHGIEGGVLAHVPEGAHEVSLTLEHVADGSVTIESMQVDGMAHDSSGEEELSDDSSHDHSHEM